MIYTRSHRYLTMLFFIGVVAQGSFPLSLGQEIPLTDDPMVILKVAHHTGLGIEFSNKGEFEKAVDAYTTALRYPKNSMTHTLLLNRGAAYLNLQKYEEALQDGETAIVLEPDNPLGYMYQAYVYWETEQMEKVVHYMTKAIDLESHRVMNSFVLDYESHKEVYATDPLVVATATEKVFKDINNTEGRNYYMRGIAYAELGENEKSIKDLTKAIEVGFRKPEVYHDRGSIYETLGMDEEAERDFSQALTADGEAVESHEQPSAMTKLPPSGRSTIGRRIIQKPGRASGP